LAEDAEEMATARAVAGQAPTLDGLCSVLMGTNGRSGNAPAARNWEEKFLSLTDAQVNVAVVVIRGCLILCLQLSNCNSIFLFSFSNGYFRLRIGVVGSVLFRSRWGHLRRGCGRWPLYMCGRPASRPHARVLRVLRSVSYWLLPRTGCHQRYGI